MVGSVRPVLVGYVYSGLGGRTGGGEGGDGRNGDRDGRLIRWEDTVSNVML